MADYNYQHRQALLQAALEAHLAQRPVLIAHPLLRRAQVLDPHLPLAPTPQTLPQALEAKKPHHP